MLRRAMIMLAVLAVVAGLAAPARADAVDGRRSVPVVRWGPCTDDAPRTDRCGTLQVPLDYDHPHGRQIRLALIKQPATDRAHRIGSLLINPGGPGGSGVDFVAQAGSELFTAPVRARFDLIGFDPRGTGRSTPLRCFTSDDQTIASRVTFPYPDSVDQERQQYAANDVLRNACATHGGAILYHMATADVARDMDTIRRAVHDRRLNYYGISYGSFLGTTYANLFPHRVRALAIDGVLDPVALATGSGEQSRTLPYSTRVHSARGADATLRQFFALCDRGGANCPFAPHAAQRYTALYRALAKKPLIIHIDGSLLRYDKQVLVSDSFFAMYRSDDWPSLAAELADVEQRVAHRTSTATTAARLVAAHAQWSRVSSGADQYAGIACSDSNNPRNPTAWASAARLDGRFGPIWTWASSACAGWPGHDQDRYLGPFTHRTSEPVLIVGNLYDPATPYQDAQAVAGLLPNSRLLTVRGWGHTSLDLSHCATAAISRYLLTTRTPPPGTVCDADSVPFASAPSTTPATPSRIRSALMPVAP